MTEDPMPEKPGHIARTKHFLTGHRPAAEHEYVARIGHILTGRSLPTTDELIRLYPWLSDSIYLDAGEWATHQITRLNATRVPDLQVLRAFEMLLDAVKHKQAEALDGAAFLLMHALPKDDSDGRLRCLIYRASLGNWMSQVAVAENAAAALVAAAERAAKGEEPGLANRTLAWSALGWLAALASRDEFEPLAAARPRPLALLADTAQAYGRMVVEWLEEEAPDPDVHKRELIRKAGGGLGEELAANWLDMPVDDLRRHADAGDVLAVNFGGRTIYPGFQLKNAMSVLTMREILSLLPIRDPWTRLEWFVTPDESLGLKSPIEAMQSGRPREVVALARSLKDNPPT